MSLHLADERELLDGMLDRQRDQIAGVLDDLDDSEARSRRVPSLTTPLGLVKHAVFVEKVWFHSRVAGVARSELGLPDTVDESFVLESTDSIDGVRKAFLDAAERSRTITASHDLDDRFQWYDNTITLRFVYGHMIAEFSRHAGHGDILVEQIRADRTG